jgi:hypothetical protein
MNADTRSPHLDLEDLIAEAAGQPIGDQARDHLTGCEHCQLEANRWNLVADGSAAWRPQRRRQPSRRQPSLPGRGAPDSVS